MLLILRVKFLNDGSSRDNTDLKIPKWKGEAVNQGTDNTMTKTKRKKRRTVVYERLHRKSNME